MPFTCGGYEGREASIVYTIVPAFQQMEYAPCVPVDPARSDRTLAACEGAVDSLNVYDRPDGRTHGAPEDFKEERGTNRRSMVEK